MIPKEQTRKEKGPPSKKIKASLIFLVFLMTIAVNTEDNVMARLGLETNYLMMALVAIVVAGLMVYRNLALVVLVLFLSIGANMPKEFMLNFGMDRDYFVGILVAILMVPLVARFLD